MAKNPPEKKIDIEKLREATKQPPAAVEVEREVLGAMLLENEAVPKALEILKPECFFDKKNRIIYETMCLLFDANEPIDTISVYEELGKQGKAEGSGGVVYLSKLTEDISSAANIEYHARVVLEKWILRSIITTSLQMAHKAYDAKDDVFEILDSAEAEIFKIAEEGLKESYVSLDKAVKDAMEYIEAIHSKKISTFAVQTDFYQLDEMLGGLQKSDLLIIAARPSMGKTAFALSLARNTAVGHNTAIAFFSLEMSTIQLATRLISAESKINAHSIRTGKFRPEEGAKISKTIHNLSKAPIYIDDTPAQNVLQIRAKCRRLKAEKNIGLIIIDYLQLMTSSSRMESREREISSISSSLKALAKELNIPVIALAQLNRAVEARQDKKPMLSDLRESGSIEQDADVVLFLTRPEVYGIQQLADGESTEGYAELIIAKQRNGPTGDIPLRFIKEYARFENPSLPYQEGQKQVGEAPAAADSERDLPF